MGSSERENRKQYKNRNRRRLGIQSLEARRLLAADLSSEASPAGLEQSYLPYQNPIQAADVNFDGRVSAADALQVINDLGRSGTAEGEFPSSSSTSFFDVSGDSQLSALDALMVINSLSRSAEGEDASGDSSFAVRSDSVSGTLSVTGSVNDDLIEVNRFGGEIIVTHRTLQAGNIVSVGTDRFLSQGINRIVVTGDSGDDTIRVNFPATTVGASVTIDGGTGDDELETSGINGMLVGGPGSDSLLARSSRVGVDYRLAPAAVNVDLEAGRATSDGFGTADSMFGIDMVFGSSLDDVITGNHLANFLDGGDGDDELNGLSNDDVIFGRSGADEIRGGTGNDFLVGGTETEDESDNISGDSGDDNVEGGGGSDDLSGGSGHDEISGGRGPDIIEGGDGDDVLSGGDGDDSIFGENGSDEILGMGGDDRLEGGGGNDSLSGASGNDVIYGGDGNDELSAGAGDDFMQGNAGNDVIAGGSGVDTVDYASAIGDDTDSAGNVTRLASEKNGISVDLTIGSATGEGNDSLSGVEGVVGSAGRDRLTVTATQRASGGPGDDRYFVDGGEAIFEKGASLPSAIADPTIEYGDEFAALIRVLDAKAAAASPEEQANFRNKITEFPTTMFDAAQPATQVRSGFGLTDDLANTLAARDDIWDVPPPSFGLGGFIGQVVEYAEEKRDQAADALSPVTDALGTVGDVIQNTAESVFTSVVGALEGVGEGVVSVVSGVIEILSDPLDKESWVKGFDQMWDGIVEAVTAPVTAAVSIVLDFVAEIRGLWYGRGLSADESRFLRSVYGSDIDTSEVRIIMNDSTTQNGRAHVHGTTIHWPDNVSPLSLDRIATFVHEAAHVVQKQSFYFDVVGRTALPQVRDYLRGDIDLRTPRFIEHDWFAGPPEPVSGELYSPDVKPLQTSNALLRTQGAEAHATSIEQMFLFLTLLNEVDVLPGISGPVAIPPSLSSLPTPLVAARSSLTTPDMRRDSTGNDIDLSSFRISPNINVGLYGGWRSYVFQMRREGWFNSFGL